MEEFISIVLYPVGNWGLIVWKDGVAKEELLLKRTRSGRWEALNDNDDTVFECVYLETALSEAYHLLAAYGRSVK